MMVTAKKICIYNISQHKYNFSCKARLFGIERKLIFDGYPLHTRTNFNSTHKSCCKCKALRTSLSLVTNLLLTSQNRRFDARTRTRVHAPTYKSRARTRIKSTILTCMQRCTSKSKAKLCSQSIPLISLKERYERYALVLLNTFIGQRISAYKKEIRSSFVQSSALFTSLKLESPLANKYKLSSDTLRTSQKEGKKCMTRGALKAKGFIRNKNLLLGIKEASFKTQDNIFKDRGKVRLSGEIFKEKETDILQTSSEQVAYSLKSQELSHSQLYKSTLWKNIRNGPNRRLPYFTKTKSCLLSLFPNVTKKFSIPHLQSNWRRDFRNTYNSSFVQILLPYLKRARDTFFSQKLSPSTRHTLAFVEGGTKVKFREQIQNLYTGGRQARTNLVTTQNRKFDARVTNRRFDAPTEQRRTSYKSPICMRTRFGRTLTSTKNQNTTFSFTIKIGDYLSSGDPIGEKSVPLLRKLTPCTYVHGRESLGKIRVHQREQHDVPEGVALCSISSRQAQHTAKGLRTSTLYTSLARTSHAQRVVPMQAFASPAVLRKERKGNHTNLLTSTFIKTNILSLTLNEIYKAKRGSRDAHTWSKSTYKCVQIKDLYAKLCKKILTCSASRSKGKKKSSLVSYARKPIVLSSSGRVLAISKNIVILQKTQPVLFYNSASLHVKKGEWVSKGSPILTLTHQTLITGDIVQGIPRIEQLFEAFTSPPPAFKDKRVSTKFKDVHDTLHSQVRDIFRKYWLKDRLPIAVRKSLEEIGYILVEMIQKVYLSQGVLIADKHIEIIIRQIASKGQILDSGSTGLFLEEILPIQQIENANLTTAGKKCLYVPAIMGLTAASLNSDSFISAASFQETTRVLSRDAVVGKSDFLRGLKEKVVIGDLISAGTGLDIYFIYNTMTVPESKAV